MINGHPASPARPVCTCKARRVCCDGGAACTAAAAHATPERVERLAVLAPSINCQASVQFIGQANNASGSRQASSTLQGTRPIARPASRGLWKLEHSDRITGSERQAAAASAPATAARRLFCSCAAVSHLWRPSVLAACRLPAVFEQDVWPSGAHSGGDLCVEQPRPLADDTPRGMCAAGCTCCTAACAARALVLHVQCCCAAARWSGA